MKKKRKKLRERWTERRLLKKMRRKERKNRPKKYRFRNLSLRMSFMAYMLIFSLLAVILVSLSVSGLMDMQNDLYWDYELPTQYTYRSGELGITTPLDPNAYTFPSANEIYADEEDVPDRWADSLVGPPADMNFHYDYNGNLMAYSYGQGGMPPDVRTLYDLYGYLAVASIPFWIIICLLLASFLFYRNKLKRPIAILRNASQQIAEDNLDFHVEYDLRDEMGDLCRSFEKMRGALYANHAEMWRAMEERKRLNAAFSHDLRTPLTVLHGYQEMLSERLPEGRLSTEKVAETLDSMGAQITRLNHYVENMQSLQRLEDVAANPVPVDTASFTEMARTAAEIICDASGKSLSMRTEFAKPTINVDLSIVQRVFDNLLSNAVRFAENKVSIHIVSAADTLSITVHDDGHGFTEESLRRAKDPFYSSGSTDGTHFGLGLNICDTLCAKHGGHLSVSNAQDGGGCVEAIFSEDLGHS